MGNNNCCASPLSENYMREIFTDEEFILATLKFEDILILLQIEINDMDRKKFASLKYKLFYSDKCDPMLQKCYDILIDEIKVAEKEKRLNIGNIIFYMFPFIDHESDREKSIRNLFFLLQLIYGKNLFYDQVNDAITKYYCFCTIVLTNIVLDSIKQDIKIRYELEVSLSRIFVSKNIVQRAKEICEDFIIYDCADNFIRENEFVKILKFKFRPNFLNIRQDILENF